MSIPNFDLSGKTALVTGGARGIGKAICRAFAGAGASVVVSDVDSAEAERTTVELAKSGADCIGVPLDVTDSGSITAATTLILEQFGCIDILVNNAGINTARDRVTIENYSFEDWKRILSVDLDGVFLVSQAVIPHIRAAGGGRIINISSVLGIVPARLQSGYVAAKAAVANLTKSMALELAADGILVNAIAPGSTLTDGTRRFVYGNDAAYREQAQSLLDHIPLHRPGEPEEIAAAALFLASPAASYITGVVLPVDGGWTAGYIRDW